MKGNENVSEGLMDTDRRTEAQTDRHEYSWRKRVIYPVFQVTYPSS